MKKISPTIFSLFCSFHHKVDLHSWVFLTNGFRTRILVSSAIPPEIAKNDPRNRDKRGAYYTTIRHTSSNNARMMDEFLSDISDVLTSWTLALFFHLCSESMVEEVTVDTLALYYDYLFGFFFFVCWWVLHGLVVGVAMVCLSLIASKNWHEWTVQKIRKQTERRRELNSDLFISTPGTGIVDENISAGGGARSGRWTWCCPYDRRCMDMVLSIRIRMDLSRCIVVSGINDTSV